MVLADVRKVLAELRDDLVLVALVERRDELTRFFKLSLDVLELLSERSSVGLGLGEVLLSSLELESLVSELLLQSLDLSLKIGLVI